MAYRSKQHGKRWPLKSRNQSFITWRVCKRKIGNNSHWMRKKPVSIRVTFKLTHSTSRALVRLRSVPPFPSAYWVSFGPHGPREPIHPPGSGIKLLLGITGCITAAIAAFALIRLNCKAYFSLNPYFLSWASLTKFPLCVRSSWASSYHDEGMARGFNRACDPTKNGTLHITSLCM